MYRLHTTGLEWPEVAKNIAEKGAPKLQYIVQVTTPRLFELQLQIKEERQRGKVLAMSVVRVEQSFGKGLLPRGFAPPILEE